jgi:hypothetical protein
MENHKNVTWYDDKIVPEEMIRGAKGEIPGFLILEHSSHFPILKSLIDLCKDCKTLLDIGCGSAEVSRVFSNFDYTGADLENIINLVSKKMHPQNNYIIFDAYDNDFKFVKNHDIILMNSFLSEIQNSEEILSKILKFAKNYVIIHRQDIIKESTKNEEYNSYGGTKATNSFLNSESIDKLCKLYNFNLQKIVCLYGTKHSIIFKKII